MRAALLLLPVLLACGRGPVCPRLNNSGGAPPPAPCQQSPHACAHTHRVPVPAAPMLVGDRAIDSIRLDEYARRLELFAAMDWVACSP